MSACGPDSCSSGGDVRLRDKSLGGTYRFRFPVTKDGEDIPWTGLDSVSLLFRRPDGTELDPVEAVLEEPDAGVWYYDTLPTDLDQVGYWEVEVTVTDGAVVIEWPYDITFFVRE